MKIVLKPVYIDDEKGEILTTKKIVSFNPELFKCFFEDIQVLSSEANKTADFPFSFRPGNECIIGTSSIAEVTSDGNVKELAEFKLIYKKLEQHDNQSDRILKELLKKESKGEENEDSIKTS